MSKEIPSNKQNNPKDKYPVGTIIGLGAMLVSLYPIWQIVESASEDANDTVESLARLSGALAVAAIGASATYLYGLKRKQ